MEQPLTATKNWVHNPVEAILSNFGLKEFGISSWSFRLVYFTPSTFMLICEHSSANLLLMLNFNAQKEGIVYYRYIFWQSDFGTRIQPIKSFIKLNDISCNQMHIIATILKSNKWFYISLFSHPIYKSHNWF